MSTLSVNKTTRKSATAISLNDLKDIIESELTFWAHWTTALQPTPSYTDITSSESAETKALALRHILENLPIRYTALAKSYSISEDTENIVLSDILTSLLKSVKKGSEQVELEEWFGNKLFKGKKFRQDVLTMDDEVRRLEEGRMEELKGLMVVCEELRILEKEGKVGKEDVKWLVEAMDEVGLFAGDE